MAKKSWFAARAWPAELSRVPGFPAAARLPKPGGAPVPSSPARNRRNKERVVNDRSVSISPPSSAPAPARAATSPTAARTRLLLKGPILPTLLRLSAPNVLNLLSFAGMILFDGFFLGRISTDALAGASPAPNRLRRPADVLKWPLLRLEDQSKAWERWFALAGVVAPERLPGPVLNRASMLIDAAIDGQDRARPHHPYRMGHDQRADRQTVRRVMAAHRHLLDREPEGDG